jgi:hypothetical protein
MTRLSSSIVSAGLLFMALATVRGITPAVQAQPFVTEDQLKDQDELHIFTGTIVSTKSQMFVLKDEVKNASYGLDNQVLAAKFVDRKVSVTGSLDKMGVIHVKNIEEQKA